MSCQHKLLAGEEAIFRKPQQGRLTFRYPESGSRECKRITPEVQELMRRFLQHLLPKGFQKIRYYGFLSAKNRKRLERIKSLLGDTAGSSQDPQKQPLAPCVELRCPHCAGPLILLGKLARSQRGRGYAALRLIDRITAPPLN